jgi:hypothetical protein
MATTNRRRKTLSRRPHKGYVLRPPAKETEIRSPEVPSVDRQPEVGPRSPQIDNNLWIT